MHAKFSFLFTGRLVRNRGANTDIPVQWHLASALRLEPLGGRLARARLVDSLYLPPLPVPLARLRPRWWGASRNPAPPSPPFAHRRRCPPPPRRILHPRPPLLSHARSSGARDPSVPVSSDLSLVILVCLNGTDGFLGWKHGFGSVPGQTPGTSFLSIRFVSGWICATP